MAQFGVQLNATLLRRVEL